MTDEYIDKVEVGAKIQMMYIRREMDYGGENDFCRGMRKALRVIDNMPAANVQPIRHGRWEYYKNNGIFDTHKCTLCGEKYEMYMDIEPTTIYKYCPHCGARMDGEQK
jgi:hypothetical protein